MIDARDDPWVGWSRLVLVFTGVCYLLLGGLMGVAIGTGFLFHEPGRAPPPPTLTLVMGVVAFVFTAGFAGLNFVAAWGLGRGDKWAWIITLILAAMYVPSICLPFGAVLLYGMLNETTRRRFLG